MRVRFQADADFNEEIVSGLIRQKPDVDFQTAEEAELRGMADPEVLTRAADETEFSSRTTAVRCPATSPISSEGVSARE